MPYISRLPEPVGRPSPTRTPAPAAAREDQSAPRKLSKLPRPSPPSTPTKPAKPAAKHQHQHQQMAPRLPPARGAAGDRQSIASLGGGTTSVLYGPRPRRKLVSPRKPSLPSPSEHPSTLIYTSQVQSHHPRVIPCPDPVPHSAAPSSPPAYPYAYATQAFPQAYAPAALYPAVVTAIYAPRPAPAAGYAAPAAAAAAASPHPPSLLPARRPSQRTRPTLTLASPAPTPSRRASQRTPTLPRRPSLRPATRRARRPSTRPTLPPVQLSGLPLPVGSPPARKSPIGEKAVYRERVEGEVRELLARPAAPLTPPKTPPPPPAKRPLVQEKISVIPLRRPPAPLSLSLLPPEPASASEDTPTPTSSARSSPSKLRQALAAELPIAPPSQVSSVHRRPALRHLPVSVASTASTASLYTATPELEMELELEQELEMENTLVFAGESSGSEMGKGFPSAAGSGSGQGQGQGMDTPFETSGLWRELEGMLGGIGPVGSVGEEEGRAGKGERQAKGEKDGKEEEGQSAYIPVFGPALAAALARNAPPQPRTPSTGSSLHKDVKDVLQGLTWSDEEWEDEPEEEEEEEEDGQTPVVERTGRLFARPTLRRSQRSVRRRPTRRL